MSTVTSILADYFSPFAGHYDIIEAQRFAEDRVCPHWGVYILFAMANSLMGVQRFVCRDCKKSFVSNSKSNGFNVVSTKYPNNYLAWKNLVNCVKETEEKRNILFSFVLSVLMTVNCRDLSNWQALPPAA